MPTNVLEPKRTVHEPKRNLIPAEPEADLLTLDETLDFEDFGAGEHQACLPEPWPTATTRVLCEL